jgi:hypothetical protein
MKEATLARLAFGPRPRRDWCGRRRKPRERGISGEEPAAVTGNAVVEAVRARPFITTP